MSNQHTPSELLTRRSKATVTAATPADMARWSPLIPQWKVERSKISREFKFEDFYRTIAFVNAVAWIANQEDHHPDLAVGFNRCMVEFSTHSVGGLSENDFICAAKVDRMRENS
jgi:4a-hydroxytetrahydrobiopterin dehydratase